MQRVSDCKRSETEDRRSGYCKSRVCYGSVHLLEVEGIEGIGHMSTCLRH